MADLSVNIAGVHFNNPIIAASGTIGFGREYSEFYPLSVFGGISCKGTTLKERPGNPPPRIAETPMGMLNCVGLQNKGVDYFIETIYPRIRHFDTNVIVNVSGSNIDAYVAAAAKIDALDDIPAIELNVSCPNVKQGGMAFGVTCSGIEQVTKAVREVYHKHLMVKLSPNVTNIAEIALAHGSRLIRPGREVLLHVIFRHRSRRT